MDRDFAPNQASVVAAKLADLRSADVRFDIARETREHPWLKYVVTPILRPAQLFGLVRYIIS